MRQLDTATGGAAPTDAAHGLHKKPTLQQQLLLLLQPVHCAQTILLEACAELCTLLVQILKLCATSISTKVLLAGCCGSA
jgi:hypothetical protein